jgi:hypothetical protein
MPASAHALSRRSVLRTVAHATAIAALSRHPGSAAAAPAIHPIVGSWLATTPQGPAHAVFAPFGEVIIAWPHSEDITAGTFPYTTAATGAWRPTGPFSLRFLVIEIVSEGGLAADYATLECEIVVDAPTRSFRSADGSDILTCGIAADRATTADVTGYRMLTEE